MSRARNVLKHIRRSESGRPVTAAGRHIEEIVGKFKVSAADERFFLKECERDSERVDARNKARQERREAEKKAAAKR